VTRRLSVQVMQLKLRVIARLRQSVLMTEVTPKLGVVGVTMARDEVAPDVPPKGQGTRRNTLEGGSLADRSARRC
jgi:hypothetical protein